MHTETDGYDGVLIDYFQCATPFSTWTHSKAQIYNTKPKIRHTLNGREEKKKKEEKE